MFIICGNGKLTALKYKRTSYADLGTISWSFCIWTQLIWYTVNLSTGAFPDVMNTASEYLSEYYQLHNYSRWANHCYVWPYFTLLVGHRSGYQSFYRWHSTPPTLHVINVPLWQRDCFSPHYPMLTVHLIGCFTHFSTKTYVNKCWVAQVVPTANRWQRRVLSINISRQQLLPRPPICTNRVANFIHFRLPYILVPNYRRRTIITFDRLWKELW